MKIKSLATLSGGRFLLTLDEGGTWEVTDREVVDFRLSPGRELSGEEWLALQGQSQRSALLDKAVAMLGRKPLSRRDLGRKLVEKGAEEAEVQAVLDRLTQLGALDDATYGATLVRHYSKQGYGRRRCLEKLREKGVPRELWDDLLTEMAPAESQVDAFLRKKLPGDPPYDTKAIKRAQDGLLRRGFSWGEVKESLGRYLEDASTLEDAHGFGDDY